MKIKRGDGLNVVPFIDVMLVLLALVLSISTFVAQGKIKVDVPSASNQVSQQEDLRKHTIVITSENRIYVDDKERSMEELESVIKSIPRDAIIEYKGDKHSSLEMLVGVIDLLIKQGHQSDKFQIHTQKQ